MSNKPPKCLKTFGNAASFALAIIVGNTASRAHPVVTTIVIAALVFIIIGASVGGNE